jgi:hypothetical protein
VLDFSPYSSGFGCGFEAVGIIGLRTKFSLFTGEMYSQLVENLSLPATFPCAFLTVKTKLEIVVGNLHWLEKKFAE